MRRVRSGYFRKQKKSRNIGAVAGRFAKKSKKALSKDLFRSKPLQALFAKKSSVAKKRSKDYLRKDILRKQFHNPEQKKVPLVKLARRTLEKQRFRIAQGILAVLVLWWFGILFIKPTFYLDRIHVTGTQEIQPDEIETIVRTYLNKRSPFFFKRSHLFLLRENTLEKAIRSEYSLDSLTFTSHWPSKTFSVVVQEKTSVALYNIKDEYFAIDTDGRVIRKIPQEEAPESMELPVIYQYADIEAPEIGSLVFNPGLNETIALLLEELNKYPAVEVHSFRLKESEQRSIVLKDKQTIEKNTDEAESQQLAEDALNNALDSIAQARTTEEKLLSLQAALDDIEIEKLEEERVQELLQEQKVFTPNDSYHLLELEVFTKAGWSIRFGHTILEQPELGKKYLDIFATLSGQVDLGGEVQEYVDLRFPDRIYYR